jgi:hypothetical protein
MTEYLVDEGGSYKLYYTGDTGNTGDWQTGLATSKNGVNWVKHANNPVHEGTVGSWDAGDSKINSVETANGSYRAFLTGNFANPKVGWAWSRNGVDWQDSGSALISKKAGTIYSVSIGQPRLIDEGDHYKLYTFCHDGTRSIGCFKLVPENLDGTFTSRMHDAGGRVRLVNMTWDATHTVVGDISVELRYGNSTGSMGLWTTLATGDELANVTARYYQYRIDLSVPEDWMRAIVQKVAINYEVPVTSVETIADGGTPAPCDFNATDWAANLSLDDGDHTVVVRVTDALGNTDEVQFDAKVDLYPPTGNITLEEGRWAHNSTALLIEVDANDTHPPFEMQLSRQPDFAGATWGPWLARETWQLLGSPQGNITIYMRLRDDAGRVSDTYNDSIVIDTTPPEGTLLINGGAKYTNSTSVDLSLEWTDLTGVVAMMVSNDPDFEGALWQDPMGAFGWGLEEGDGERTVHVRVRDAVGWVTTLSDSIILDRTPPAASMSIDDDAPYCTGLDVVLNLTMYDDSPINYKLVNSDDAWPEAWRTTGSPIDIPWRLASGPDGERTVRMLVRDAAGNEFLSSDDIVLDTTPPEGTLTLNGGEAFTNVVVASAVLEASDATSGLDRMRISNDDGFADASWQTVKDAFSWPLPTGDGPKTVYVQLRDGAGLTSTVDASIILDTTAPTGTFLIEDGAELVTSTTVGLAMAFQDPFGLDTVRVSNEPTFGEAPYLPYTTGMPWELVEQEGERNVYVEVSDMAGNVLSTVSSVRLDLTDPAVSLVINGGDEATLGLDVTLTWSGSDASGLASYALATSMDFGGAEWLDLSGETSITDAEEAFSLSGTDGLRTVYLGVRDIAGRLGTTSASIWYVSARPEGSLTLADGGGWTNSTTIAARAVWTGGSEATHYRVSLEQTGLVTAPWVPIADSTSLEPEAPGGTFTVHCQLLGPHNVTSLPFQESIKQDLQAPAISILSPTVDVTESDSVKVSLSVSDDMDPEPSLEWRLNGGEWTPYEEVARVSLKEGKNLIEVRSQDLAGNTGTAERTIEAERGLSVSGTSLIVIIIIVAVLATVGVIYWMRRKRDDAPPG